jgi:carbonic anhydrase
MITTRSPLTAARLCLLLSSLLPLPAEAAKWVQLDSRGGARVEVDAASVERTGGDKLRVWHRESYAKPQMPDSGAFSFVSQTVLSELQCAKRLATPIKRSYFAANGSELQLETYESRDTAPVAPDSAIESVFNFACKQKGKTPAAPVAQPAAPAPAAVVATPPPEIKTPPKKGKAGAKDEPPAPPEVPWTYEGKTGAGKWAKLSDTFAICGVGMRQSPIDIRETIRADLPPIRFSYKPVTLSIIDNGHTIQVNTPGAGGITVDGEDYELVEFHFHRPSEEKINGKSYDMEAHLVHKSKAGKLAIVAVMLQAGKEQKLVRTLWNNLPLEQNRIVSKTEISIDPTQLLPATREYFTYSGSLSTPPCSEGVLWLVLKTPTQVSKEQAAGFGKIYRNNARPIQSANGRVIKESR